jgi:hypothetical protein
MEKKLTLGNSASALVLINPAIGEESKLLAYLRKNPYTIQAYRSYGTYGLIVEVKAEDNNQLRNYVHTILCNESVFTATVSVIREV